MMDLRKAEWRRRPGDLSGHKFRMFELQFLKLFCWFNLPALKTAYNTGYSIV
jgi:hypothetical protein